MKTPDGTGGQPAPTPGGSPPNRPARIAGLRRVLAELRHVRGLRTARYFCAWAFASMAWRASRGSRAGNPANLPRPQPASLGVRIAALGDRARAVLPISELATRPDRHTELVVAESSRCAAAFTGASVALDRAPPALAVPAVDPLRYNPIGWVRNVEYRAVSLGPRRLLPAGSAARRRVHPDDRSALRYCHHVEDVQAYHANPTERAGTLVRLAAAGVPVHLADGGPGLAGLIGPELHGLMNAELHDADLDRRERISIRLRRLALREHSLRARARQLCAEAGLPDPPRPPLVSILLPTRRPELLPCALTNVAGQNYPRLELVIALHGSGFDSGAGVGRLPFPVKIVRADKKATLGSVLNLATAEAGGTLVTKMDDDDFYGANHVWDLVLAHEYSGAEAVGKGLQTVYLADAHRTIQYCLDNAESYDSLHLGGGALLISRHALDRAGGWPRIACGEDRLLLQRVQQHGGRVYRTHGSEYLVIRHGRGHAWRLPDEDFLNRAQNSRPGLCPSLVDIDAPETLSLDEFRRWQSRSAGRIPSSSLSGSAPEGRPH